MSRESASEAEARVWLGRLYGGNADVHTLDAFRIWLAASPSNARSYRQIESLWRELPAIEAIDRRPAAGAAPIGRRVRMPRATLLAGVAAAAAIAAVLILKPFDIDFSHTFATEVGEIRTVKLPDGTDVTLGPRTKLSVRVTQRTRWVALESGEAFFSVAQDAKRSLTVEAASTEVRVLGTRFDVRRGPSTVDVAVADGRVVVADRPESGAASRVDLGTVVLVRGQQVRAALDGALEAPRPVNPDRITDWRSGRLRYVDAALQDVLSDINRYSTTPIVYHDVSIGSIRITASFSVKEAQQVLDSIAASHDLVLRPDGTGWVMERR